MDKLYSRNLPIYSFQPQFSPNLQHQPQYSRNPPSYSLPYIHGGCSDNDDQKLRDEVIYLHSLWRRGPPPPNPHLLKPLHTTSFKRKSNKPQKDSGKEWPVNPEPATSSPPKQGWGSFGSRPTPKFHPPSTHEKDRVLSVRVHLRALESSVGFFCNSDDDDVVVTGGDDEEENEYDEEEAFELFMKVFDDDVGLRDYYKTKFHNGEFYCLVCGVIGNNKLGRMYRDCVALVQHSLSISKTKKRIAHRAYGRVVCKILGWDVDCLPSLPLSLTLVDANPVVENQSSELEKSSDPSQGENKNNVDGSEDNPAVIEGEGDPTNASVSQAKPENFPEAAEEENVSSVNNKSTTNEQRDSADNLPS